MKKDKNWLKEQLSYLQDGVGESFNDYSEGLNAAYNTLEILIDQLEEPEQEKLEKLYTACFAPIGTRQGVYLYRESGSVKVGDNMKVYDKSKQEYHLTEQEIKALDERFWFFAEEVPD